MTARYAMTAAQFDSIAAGYGGADAMAVLRDGQFAKRKLLLSEVLKSGPPADATELLLRAEAADPAAVAQALRLPHLDAWATGLLRRGFDAAAEDDLRYLPSIAAAAGIRARLAFTISVPVHHGESHLPGLGTAVGLGRGPARVVARADGSATITGPAGAVELGGANWHPLRSVEVEAGFSLQIEDQDPYRDCYQWQPAPRLDDGRSARFAELIRRAWAILADRHPEQAAAMRVLLGAIVPLRGVLDGISVSAASRHAAGSVAASIPDTAEELALLLQHEFMHMKLDCLRDLVDLHDENAAGRFLAPWRMDPRPVGALFQGVYAHTGVTDYWRVRRRIAATPLAELEFAYWREQNRIAVATLATSGELTAAGRRFVATMRETLDGWQREAVTSLVASKVAAMVRAQTVRWRLRNWAPTDTELGAVVKARLRGDQVPAVAPTGSLRADADAEPSGMPGIVGAIRASVVGGVPAASPADRALIAGDTATAIIRYAERAHRDLADDDAWIGLAVAMAGLNDRAARALELRPDLVRAAFRHVSVGGPVELAEWLSSGLGAQGAAA